MDRQGLSEHHVPSVRLSTLVVAVGVLGFVVWGTSPMLGHFSGALIPWPAHGVAMAILIATPIGRRMTIVALMTAAVAFAASVNAVVLDLMLPQVVPAVALLIAQTLLVTLVYDRVSSRASPLDGTTPYAWMLGAAVLGTLPLAGIASAALALGAPSAVAGYSWLAWWIAASTSGAALVGGTLTLLSGAPRHEMARPMLGVEFAALVLAYVFVAASAFAEVGPFAGMLAPALASLPFLVWSGLRFGVRGYTIIAALLLISVIASTWVDVGPFARFDEPKIDRFRRAWIYLASLVGPAMIFPVALAERGAAERRSRAALAQLRAILAGTSDLIAAVDRDLVVVAANPAWIAGYERLAGVRFEEGMSIADASERNPRERETTLALWKRALDGERFTVVREISSLEGARDEFEVTYSPVLDGRGDIVGGSQVVRNITARRQRDAEEEESRRLESVGRLAGGVAHDFNNLMTAVLGYSELIRASLDPGDERIADLAEIEKAATRAGQLTQQLLAFARRREVRPKDMDAGATVLGIVRLIAPLIGPNIQLDVRATTGQRSVRVDPTQFEQVVMNLAVNAQDAMPGGGSLLIETELETRDGVAGVRLTVSDSGEGMAPDVLERIFEPFFTTKPIGEGTGLGLATVHGIVHQAGGTIDVSSVPGRGSTFNVFFPASPASPAEDALRPAPA